MKMRKFILLVLLILVINKSYSIDNKEFHISIYGDSTIIGLLPDGKITQNNPPFVLNNELQKIFGEKVSVSSIGHIGMTLKDLINGTGLFITPFSQNINNDNGQIIIENFAINDSWRYPLQEYENYLHQFISIVKSAGKQPILEEPNPICNYHSIPNWVTLVDATIPIINRVAQQENVLVIKQYDYIKSLPNWWTMLNGCDPYGVHPNEFLYALKAHQEEIVLEPIVRSFLN